MRTAVRICGLALLLAAGVALLLKDPAPAAPANEKSPRPEPRDEPRELAQAFGWEPAERPRGETWDLLDEPARLGPEPTPEPEPEPAPQAVFRTSDPVAEAETAVETVAAVAPRRSLAGRMLSSVLWSAAAFSVLVLLAIGVGPHSGLYRTMTVLSGSMRPDISPGDMVVSTPEPLTDVRVGQVITYQIPVLDHHVETHRVVQILQGGAQPVVITQGDANNTPDPWKAKLRGTTIWRVRGTIPYLGWLVGWLRLPQLHRVLILVVPSLLALVWLVGIWSAPSRPRRRVEVRQGGAGA